MFSIEVTDLKKSYSGLKAVDGISFKIKQGEVFGLLGPNGAGKTTTIEIMEGLRERDSGDVKILGLDPWKDGYEVHKRIGVIPQDFTFFEKTTPKEAIKYYASLFNVKVDADAILKEVLLDEMEKHVFESLSGGQKQKTGLALSLVNSPEILFLDEPTTGLDPNARRAIWEVIRGLKAKGKTIILTTHYLDEAQQLSDRVAIMDHGHIVAMGTIEEIIEQNGSGERLEIHGDKQLADYIQANTELQVTYDDMKGIITIPLKKKIDMLAALAAAEQSGMKWGEIQTRQDSLDDVFIKLVNDPFGEQIEEEAIEQQQNGNKKGRQ
ncbi:MAG: ABC transporter ATP-binding protein [Candidatus Bathyarchaeota archaeon]|nr:ABC transporter ATP-binding protein [Candidatus Termiticorpusculum sp.]MCL1970283.1 ABC transporter ATP-binding protein [Candidatus Termiticorpusculum sp.]